MQLRRANRGREPSSPAATDVPTPPTPPTPTTPPTLPTFTAHNIELPDGRQTFPAAGPIRDSGVARATIRTLDSLFRADERASTTVADLGCLEGGYATAFAQAGYRAVGIEIRDQNIECCRFIEKQLALENLSFIQDDARHLAQHGPFDAIFCCGLFYHLDEPRAFLDLLSECTRRVLVLQTHYAAEVLPGGHAPLLSEMVTHEGNLGRWYNEFPTGEPSDEEMADTRWASWGNHKSFWIEKRHLLQGLMQAGFDCVYEQFDQVDDIVNDRYWEGEGRGMFVAVKTS